MARLGFGTRLRFAAKAATGVFSDDMAESAYRMLAGILPGGYGTPPARGTREFLRAYSQMPWLRAVSERIATAVAQTEWQLFVLKRGTERATKDVRYQRAHEPLRRKLLKKAADAGDLKQITDHPMLTAIAGGNSFQTGLGMRKVTQLHLDLVGDAFWLKERNGLGVPINYWPIPPDWIIATPTPVNREFRVSFRGWQGAIPDTEFVWFSIDDPANPYGRGTGPAQALADELETDEYASKHLKTFFYNRARPDLIISPKDGSGANEASIRRLEQDWIQRSQGFFRQFKPYFMNRAVDVKELDQNFRQLTLVPLRQFERDTIMQVYGIPPEILGVLEHSNRATIDAADYLMATYVVTPRLEFMRSVLQERLVPEYDDRLIVEYPSPVKEDEAQQQQAAVNAPWSISLDEWRARSGHMPMEDADAGAMHWIPAGGKFTTVEDIVNPPEPPPMPGLPPPGPGKPKPGADSQGMLPGAAGSDTNAPPEPKALRGIDFGLYRAAKRGTFAGWHVGDRFTDPNSLDAVTSMSAFDAAKKAAGLNGDAMRVKITAPPGMVKIVGQRAILPPGLTFALVRIDEDSADVEVVEG